MNRRKFLGASAFSTISFIAAPAVYALSAENTYRKNIGIQLYTLRDALKEDTSSTMKAVADAGYKQVEMYGFPNSDRLTEAAKEHGLAINSSHIQWDCVVNPPDKSFSEFQSLLEKASKTGLTHLVVPYLQKDNRNTLDDYKKVAENCNLAAEIAKSAGIELSYHNHNFEFAPMEGGKTGFDIFIENFSPNMKFEVDVFWVKVSGIDPVQLITRLKGRVSQLHLKDLKAGSEIPNFGNVPEDDYKELGQGIIDMEQILAAAELAGVTHTHVEQDHSPAPLESILKSSRYLKSL